MTTALLVVFTRTMSALPSILMSLMPPTRQFIPTVVPLMAACWTVSPFISHVVASPAESVHKTSARPSPLKSPLPATLQSIPMVPFDRPPPITEASCMVQTAT